MTDRARSNIPESSPTPAANGAGAHTERGGASSPVAIAIPGDSETPIGESQEDPRGERIQDIEAVRPSAPATNGAVGTTGNLSEIAAIVAADISDEPTGLGSRPSNRSVLPTLLGTMVFFFALAAAATLGLYVLGDNGSGLWKDYKYILAPAFGTSIGIGAAIAFALLREKTKSARPDEVDPRVFGELHERLWTVKILLPLLCPAGEQPICEHSSKLTCQASCNEARARIKFIVSELRSRGSRWVLGTGYVDLWRHLHAAEEALFAVQPYQDVVGQALFDKMRLEGANEIPNGETLRTNLHGVLDSLAEAATPPLVENPGVELGSNAVPRSPTLELAANHRIMLRDVRRAINGFRDGERANLVQARNQLAWTGTITAVAGYALLVLAMLAQAPVPSIIGGVTFFVVGATVGLFNQLRLDSNPATWHEDFGFNRARLFYTPVLSGLAAVGGVLVVSLLNEVVNFGMVAGSGGSVPVRSLDQVFDVERFSFGLLIAAVFGLTPDLLVKRLRHQADQYQAGLNNSTAAGSSTSGSAGTSKTMEKSKP